MDIKHFTISDNLKNGLPVTIRAVKSDDKELIREAFNNLEPQTIYTRFFSYKNKLTDEELKAATEADFVNQVGLVVTLHDGKSEIIIGGATFWVIKPEGDGPLRAEISFTVEEDYQGQGIASRLLKHLIQIARKMSISYLDAEVLQQNKAMLTVFERSGLPTKRKLSDGVVHLSMSLS